MCGVYHRKPYVGAYKGGATPIPVQGRADAWITWRNVRHKPVIRPVAQLICPNYRLYIAGRPGTSFNPPIIICL
jgi:hypothetical protein